MSLRTLPDRFAGFFLQTLDKVVFLGRCLDLVPNHMEHTAVCPVFRTTNLGEILPPPHVLQHTKRTLFLFPRLRDLCKGSRVGSGREFGEQRVGLKRDLATVDILAIVGEGIATAVHAVGFRESTQACPAFCVLPFESLMEFAFSALVAGSLAVAFASRHETPALVCRNCGFDASGFFRFLVRLLDAVFTANIAFATTPDVADLAKEGGIVLEFLDATTTTFVKVEVKLAHGSSVHAWTRAELTHFLLHAIDTARFSHGALFCVSNPTFRFGYNFNPFS